MSAVHQPANPYAGSSPLEELLDGLFAWIAALVPLGWIVLAFAVPWLAVSPLSVAAATAVSVVLCWIDARRLEDDGVRVDWRWSVLVGIGYLVVRALRGRRSPLVPAAWVACAALAAVSLATFARVYTLDQTQVQDTLQHYAAAHGAAGADVSCPSHMTGRKGATFFCFVTVPHGGFGSVGVTIRGHDSFDFGVGG